MRCLAIAIGLGLASGCQGQAAPAPTAPPAPGGAPALTALETVAEDRGSDNIDTPGARLANEAGGCDVNQVAADPLQGAPVTVRAVDRRWAFYLKTVGAEGGVWRAASDGSDTPARIGPTPTLQEAGLAWDLELVGDLIYYLDSGTGDISPTGGAIRRVDPAGGAPVELARADHYACRFDGHPMKLASDGIRVYWLEEPGRSLGQPGCPPDADARFRLRSVSIHGGAVANHARTASAAALAADARGVYFVDGDTIFVLQRSNGAVRPLATHAGVTALASDDVAVYAGDQGGAVTAFALADGSAHGIATGGGAVSRIVRRGTFVYWAAADGVFRARRDGSGVTALVAHGSDGLAVDADFAYFDEDGAVVRTCR